MDKLEHNIKEAFVAHDSKTKLADKNAMWNRLDNKMHARKGVAAFWRVAAVFLGLLLTAGVFASINYQAKKKNEFENLKLENLSLANSVDSLLTISATQTQAEVRIVEKEKIVYREKVVYKEATNNTAKPEGINVVLSDSLKRQLDKAENYQQQIEQLTRELEETQHKLTAFETQNTAEENETTAAPFQLKSERIELDVQKKPRVKTSDMEMKVFQKNFIENRNNLNKNIFKK